MYFIISVIAINLLPGKTETLQDSKWLLQETQLEEVAGSMSR